MRKLIVLILVMLVCGCTSKPQSLVTAEQVKGPVVFGRFSGEEVSKWLPYTEDGEKDKAVLATKKYVDDKGPASQSPKFTQDVSVIVPTDSPAKLVLAKYDSGAGHGDASTNLGYRAEYMVLGYKEYGLKSYRAIVFGYKTNLTTASPAYIGYEETDTTSNTKGDLFLATRSGTDAAAPTPRLYVKSTGDIQAASGYSPTTDQSLATKKYVDAAVAAAVKQAVEAAGKQAGAQNGNGYLPYQGITYVITCPAGDMVSGTMVYFGSSHKPMFYDPDFGTWRDADGKSYC